MEKHTLGVLHFATAIASGWALKRIVGNAYLSVAAFTILLVQNVIGFLKATHPSGGYNVQSFYTKIATPIQQLAQQLLIADALYLQMNLDRRENILVWGTLLAIIFNPVLKCLRKEEELRVMRTVIVVWNVLMLVYILRLSNEECSWTTGLATLMLLNHFLFRRLSMYFEITQIEISTIGHGFFVIFALNAINEISENVRRVSKV